jgi:hypothetical protein
MPYTSRPLAALLVLAAAAGASAQQPEHTTVEQTAIDRARKALEERHEWVDGLAVVSITPAEWRDSSLGCRKPGSSYMQVITSGYTVRFTGKGIPREVHVAGERAVVCSTVMRDRAKMAPQRVPLEKVDEMIDSARADLAMRLGGKVTEVTVVDWQPVRLPARVLRCEVSKGEEGEPAVPGYRIVLAYHARHYTYQSDMQTATACPRIEAK